MWRIVASGVGVADEEVEPLGGIGLDEDAVGAGAEVGVGAGAELEGANGRSYATSSCCGPRSPTWSPGPAPTPRSKAYFNVDRADFETDDYANGETSELAARGLYGEYALMIPAEVLSRDGSKKLVLNEIEDVLLRLDYVSVAR